MWYVNSNSWQKPSVCLRSYRLLHKLEHHDCWKVGTEIRNKLSLHKCHTNNTVAQLKILTHKKVITPKSRQQEIILLRAETNRIETEQYKESMKQRLDSLTKSTRYTNPYPSLL